MKSDSRYLQQVSYFKYVTHLCISNQFELLDADFYGFTKRFADPREKRSILTATVACDANLAVMGDILSVAVRDQSDVNLKSWMPLAISTTIPYLDADSYSQVYAVYCSELDDDNAILLTDAYESFLYQETDELVLLKFRRDINSQTNEKVRDLKKKGQVHVDPEVFVVGSYARSSFASTSSTETTPAACLPTTVCCQTTLLSLHICSSTSSRRSRFWAASRPSPE